MSQSEMEKHVRALLSLFPGHNEAKRLAEKFGLDLGESVRIIDEARQALAKTEGPNPLSNP